MSKDKKIKPSIKKQGKAGGASERTLEPYYWLEADDMSAVISRVLQDISEFRKKKLIFWKITSFGGLTTNPIANEKKLEEAGGESGKIMQEIMKKLNCTIEMFGNRDKRGNLIPDLYSVNMIDLYRIISEGQSYGVTPNSGEDSSRPFIYFPINTSMSIPYEGDNENLGSHKGSHWIFIRYDIAQNEFVICDSLKDTNSPAEINDVFIDKINEFYDGLIDQLNQLHEHQNELEGVLKQWNPGSTTNIKDILSKKIEKKEKKEIKILRSSKSHGYKIKQIDGSFCGPATLLNMILHFEGIVLPCDIEIDQEHSEILRGILYRLSIYDYLPDETDKTFEEQQEQCYYAALSDIIVCITSIIKDKDMHIRISDGVATYESNYGKQSIESLIEDERAFRKKLKVINPYEYLGNSGYVSMIVPNIYDPLIGEEIYKKMVEGILQADKDIKLNHNKNIMTKLGYDIIGLVTKGDLDKISKEDLEKLLLNNKIVDEDCVEKFNKEFIKLFESTLKNFDETESKIMKSNIERYMDVKYENNLIRCFLALSITFLVLSSLAISLNYLDVWKNLGLNNKFLSKALNLLNSGLAEEKTLFFSSLSSIFGKMILNLNRKNLNHSEKEVINRLLSNVQKKTSQKQ